MFDLFYTFITTHSEALVTAIGIYIAFKQTSKDKRIETYLQLKSTFRELWFKITAYPEENSTLLAKDIGEIHDENIKLIVYQILDLFNDVHYYYTKTGQDIEHSDWHNKINHVLHSNLFMSAFKKHQATYNKAFKTYIQYSVIRIEDK